MSQFYRFLRSPGVLLATSVLIVHAAVFYSVSTRAERFITAPFSTLPELGEWRTMEQRTIQGATWEALGADDYLLRSVERPDGWTGDVYIAYFRTQRAGRAPHSPRNCLPGSGWAQERGRTVSLNSAAGPFVANLFLVAKGEVRAVVAYWYQSRYRCVAGEYAAKLHLIADALRYSRSDTTLVRVTVPVRSADLPAAEKVAFDLAREAHAAVTSHFVLADGL